MEGGIATGEIEDTRPPPKSAAAEMAAKGGQRRAAKLAPKARYSNSPQVEHDAGGEFSSASVKPGTGSCRLMYQERTEPSAVV